MRKPIKEQNKKEILKDLASGLDQIWIKIPTPFIDEEIAEMSLRIWKLRNEIDVIHSSLEK